MDFGTLLHTAKKNESTKKEVRYYSTKFEPPKKEQRNKSLSANIQKFLAKKEAEEKQEQLKAKKKKDELFALRAQDKKSTRRINVMLKRTKSANQSVLADAVDNEHTAVTLAGNAQPDEDDYGYVSQEASAFYNKMMEKYNKMPDEPKYPTDKRKVSSNLNSTRERVKAALEREKEEASMPHRRKRKRENVEEQTKKEVETRLEEKPISAPKPKHKPAPSPINFTELLKMAEKKQFEPIVIEKKEVEEERPLTKKQKRELEFQREYLERKTSKVSEKPPVIAKIPKINSNTEKNKDKIPRLNGYNKPKSSEDARISKVNNDPIPKTKLNNDLNRKQNDVRMPRELEPPKNKSSNNTNTKQVVKSKPSTDRTKTFGSPDPLPQKSDSKLHKKIDSNKNEIFGKKSYLFNSLTKSNNNNDKLNKNPLTQNNGKTQEPSMKYFQQRKPQDVHQKKPQLQDVRQSKFPQDLKPQLQDVRQSKSPQDLKPKQFPPADLKPKQFPPADLKPRVFPPPDMQRRDGLKQKPKMQKRRILDDEDYDSEMDDFIDDGPQDDYSSNYSKYISEIFGYDKSKYRYVEDDIDNMESTFAQQMREEVISGKIGLMEDLEDMKLEEEQKRRKATNKKNKP